MNKRRFHSHNVKWIWNFFSLTGLYSPKYIEMMISSLLTFITWSVFQCCHSLSKVQDYPPELHHLFCESRAFILTVLSCALAICTGHHGYQKYNLNKHGVLYNVLLSRYGNSQWLLNMPEEQSLLQENKCLWHHMQWGVYLQWKQNVTQNDFKSSIDITLAHSTVHKYIKFSIRNSNLSIF